MKFFTRIDVNELEVSYMFTALQTEMVLRESDHMRLEDPPSFVMNGVPHHCY
jgi:hypothetical protein